MNRLLLLLLLLFCCTTSYQQPNYLFIKKGFHKKKTYEEGDRIHIQLNDGKEKTGIITRIINNSVYINGEEIAQEEIAAVLLDGKKKKPFPVDFKTMLLIGAGAGLTTLGLSLNDANEPTTALVAGLTIGYGPLLLKHFGGRILYALKRKKYKMGKRFRLQVFDIYVPPKRPF
jgi:hypothetical protein